MLLILYGATAEMGRRSREYLTRSGYALINKLNYAPPGVAAKQPLEGERVFTSKEDFYDKTDSLFRYEFDGILIGFSQDQILDAVSNKTDRLLTISTENIHILSEIKRVHGDNVKIIYCYIDNASLKKIYESYGRSEEELRMRMTVARKLQNCYAENVQLFDFVILYEGKDSVFNDENLEKQYERIVRSLSRKSDREDEKFDVYISRSGDQQGIYREIKERLTESGISVFDEEKIPPGAGWGQLIKKAVANSRIFVFVVSASSLGNQAMLSELRYAIKNTGTNIIPLFLEPAKSTAPYLLNYLERFPGIMAEGRGAQAAAELVCKRIRQTLEGIDRLQVLSEQVNNYTQIHSYLSAAGSQEEHFDLCRELYGLSGGTVVSLDALLYSGIRLIGILIDLKDWKGAVDRIFETIGAVRDGADDRIRDVLAEQFVSCCIGMNLTREDVQKLIDEKADVDLGSERLLEKFDALSRSGKISASREEAKDDSEEKLRIANYGELALSLFDALMRSEASVQKTESLKTGYERILEYCKHLGFHDDVAEKCIQRIAELSEKTNLPGSSADSEMLEALKIYLGLARPKNGKFDVFLSYKSEDEVLAKKVLEFLELSGKVVFFSKKDLPRSNESEYKLDIEEAIDRSKHMIVIASDPEYLKTKWVLHEWNMFDTELVEDRRNGKLLLIVTDELAEEFSRTKDRLHIGLRGKDYLSMSEFRNKLLAYLW